MRDQYMDRLNSAKSDINNFESIVGKKVEDALQHERREMDRLRRENQTLLTNNEALNFENKSL